MKSSVRHIAAAAMLAVMGTAQASSVTVPTGSYYNGLQFSGTASLTFSYSMLSAMDMMKVAVTDYGAATTTKALDSDGYYIFAGVSAPLTSVTVDNANNTLVGATTTGGLTMTTPLIRDVTNKGSLTITDLSIDLANQLVYGTISGNNLAPKTEALWTIGSITGNTAINSVGTYATTLTDLKLTTDALNDFALGLSASSISKNTLQALGSFGSMQLTLVPALVPEPSSYALMGLGLAGVAFATKRRRKG